MFLLDQKPTWDSFQHNLQTALYRKFQHKGLLLQLVEIPLHEDFLCRR
nr:hypothetical protein Iba_chr10aCG4470 [Ipomoea batatas]GMD41889.1 hypothetical protein Iba_chr10bCG4030 [Ipomoea batatas]GMD43079.1 hypothetical protein Iba_chr10cCG1830 [Ipomoea batatas]